MNVLEGQIISPATLRPRIAVGVLTIILSVTVPAHAQDEDIVARVNGQPITETDLATAERMYAAQLGEMAEDARRSVIVDALVDSRLVADAARSQGISETDEFRSQMAFFEEQTLGGLYTERMMADAVDDADVRQAYDAQVANLPKSTEKRVRHILVADEAEAEALIASLNAGEEFDALARENSLDGMSKDNGGDLGYLAEGRMIPEIEAAVDELEPGDIADVPVQSAFGFHVVKLEDERSTPPRPFDAVAPQIRQALENAAQRDLLTRLRAEASVEKLVPDVTPEQPDDGHQH